MITATAKVAGLDLVTSDQKILTWASARTDIDYLNAGTWPTD